VAGGLPSLLAGRFLTGSGICPGPLDACPDLRAGFLAGLIRGILQMCDLLLQGVNALSQTARLTNAHLFPQFDSRRAGPLTAQVRLLPLFSVKRPPAV
jgi:hypothetical protein